MSIRKLFQQHPSITTQAMLNDNLSFFRESCPDIYNAVKEHTFKKYTLDFNVENQKIDILDAGNPLYFGDIDAYTEMEVENYGRTYCKGKSFMTSAPPFSDMYRNPRFFHKRMNKIICQSPLNKDNFKGYPLGDFYPMTTFFGCGAGVHIEKMLQQHKILNVIIVEPEIELFYASLYLVNWKNIYKNFLQDNTRSIQLIIGQIDNQQELFTHVWLSLEKYRPAFPLGGLFYNHLGKNIFTEIITRLRKEYSLFFNNWGCYDDEVNQLNNVLHNLHENITIISKPSDIHIEVPACIVGNGPSLDKRIDDLRAIKDKAIIFSCGTATKALLNYHIVPDYHIEAESHYRNHEISLLKIADNSSLDKITILGAAQLTPKSFRLFKKKLSFITRATGLFSLLADDDEILHGTTPTCTNAGLSVATHFRFKTILFFGMDYGFETPDKHHSEKSTYYTDKDDLPQVLKNTVADYASSPWRIKSVNGKEIYSTTTLYTSLRGIESYLSKMKNTYELKAYNCSEGADITGANYLKTDKFEEFLSNLNSSKSNVLKKLDELSVKSIPIDEIYKQTKIYQLAIAEIAEHVSSLIIKNLPNDVESMFRTIFTINEYMNNDVRKSKGSIYFTLSSAIWHFLYIGTSHAFALGDDSGPFIKVWTSEFLEFLRDVPEHFKKITEKNYPAEDDPWIHAAIEDPTSQE